MTLRQIWQVAKEQLNRAAVPDAGFDARELLKRSFGLDTAQYLMREGSELETVFPDRKEREERLGSFYSDIGRRATRIPLQQILGECEFYGLPFFVNEHVLCPRQDTETLVEKVLQDYASSEKSGLRVLDLCTGSGCIALSLARIGGFPDVTAADVSEDALQVARKNAERLLPDGSLRLLHSDLFQEISGSFDLIVSNPPYIPTAEIGELEPEVREHEPRLALDGSTDGLFFYRRITGEAPSYLRPDGQLYVEIGYDQGESVQELFREAGFRDIGVRKDLGGNDRVVFGRKG